MKKLTNQQKKSRLKKQLDKLMQEKLLPKNPRCLVCGNPTSEMHHYIEKSKSLYLRWNPKNLVPLCRQCHCKHHFSGDPRIVQEIVRKKGHQWADELERDRRKVLKDNLKTLEAIYESFT